MLYRVRQSEATRVAIVAEGVWFEDYADLEHTDESICEFIRNYNSERMRSALSYHSPEQFELSLAEYDQP